MKTTKILSVLGVMILLSACGSKTARTANDSSALGSAVGNTTGNLGGNGGSGGGLGTGGGGNIYNLPLAPERLIQVSGTTGTAPVTTLQVLDANGAPASSAKTLRIKVTAMSAPHLTVPGYTNWVFPYGCMQLTVTVNGATQSTQVLRVSNAVQGATSPCANAPDHQILDFSNSITGSSYGLTVTISDPQYDNCRYYYPLNYGCQMSAVWSNHMVAATVATQIDGMWLNP